MAYMQLEYHNASSQLTPQELMYIRHQAVAREQEIVAAARCLRRIIERGEGGADLHRVLERFSASINTAHIPKRFIMELPTARPMTSSLKQHERLFYSQTHNRSYICRLRCQHGRQRKASAEEDHHFQVPTSPLPLSFSAQLDSARLHGDPSRRRGQASSGYAPLFSKWNSTPVLSRELSPLERETLKFLMPSKRSPKAETRKKPGAKSRALLNGLK